MDAVKLARLLADEVDRSAYERPVLGIDGPDAAGKTTLADAVAKLVIRPVVRASVDGFHRPAAVRRSVSYEDSFNVGTLVGRLLEPFSAGAPEVLVAAFDLDGDVPAEVVAPVPARAALVLDGVFLHRLEIRPFLSLSVFLDVPPEETLRRARVRDAARLGTELEHRYATRYLPAQARYRPTVRPDRLVDNTDPSSPVLCNRTSPP